jgi:hypothetical protein
MICWSVSYIVKVQDLPLRSAKKETDQEGVKKRQRIGG